jgi:hypothetical protein
MNKWLFGFLLAFFCIACKSKKKNAAIDNSKFFPVVSFLQSQVKGMDTSLQSITKIEMVNGKADTTVIPREDFRNYAKDFLEIPDITQKKWKGDYTESTDYDESMERAVLIYTATDPELELRQQHVTILPTFGGNDEVKTIFLHKITNDDESTVEKKMYWEVNNYFTITTITQKENAPEQVRKLQVFWRGF